MRQTGAVPIEPDTKDWTWVLERPCPECGFEPAGVAVAELADLIQDNAPAGTPRSTAPDAAVRPAASVWSPLEYACHVRDVHRLFAERLTADARARTTRSSPTGTRTSPPSRARYAEQDPATVAVELVEAAADAAAIFACVRGDQWQRRGRRSNGSVFTVATLGVYYLHDVVHHLHDIGGESPA